ncbi:hypothetical protein ACI2JA_06265 [Alkalihalobacillus sp. NPDC078783]
MWIQSILFTTRGSSGVGMMPIVLVAVSVGLMVIIMGALLIYLSRKRQKQ